MSDDGCLMLAGTCAESKKNEVCQNVQQPAVLAWHATHFTCILSAHSVKQTYIVNMYTVTDTIIKEQH